MKASVHYYNEWDKYPAQWLRNLQEAGHLAVGVVDERSIVDVQAKDLEGVIQAHFFAGIGGWSLALRLAGWSEDWPVWTGSCPCQPFSVAGKRKGKKDKRHLWPDFFRLIGERRPPVVFGEQVAGKDGRAWLSGVRADLEGLGYAFGGGDLCAAGAGEEGEGWIMRGNSIHLERLLIGAPNIRQRLFWVAHPRRPGLEGLPKQPARQECQAAQRSGVLSRLADAQDANGRSPADPKDDWRRSAQAGGSGRVGWLDDAAGERADIPSAAISGGNRKNHGLPIEAGNRSVGMGESDCSERGQGNVPKQARANGSNPWASFDVLPCADGKARRVESGTFPLVDGVPARVGKLRAYGNAINPWVAARFVRAYMEVRGIV